MEAYFSVESLSQQKLTFQVLQMRLIKTVNERILNGEFTERGLAKLLGISQPQIHNVLKGARKLGLELADRLLWAFGLTVFDLFVSEELHEQSIRRKTAVPEALRLERFPSPGAPKKRATRELYTAGKFAMQKARTGS
jgi:plasmid maintenance system antidote protein VapI